MKAIASKRRRFGYRRIGVLLERKGMIMNHKKLYRLYTEEKLGVRRRRGRKRARGSRTPMPVALRPGERWSLDFVSDTFGASTARQCMFTCMRGTQVPYVGCE
jgi:putative transposase